MSKTLLLTVIALTVMATMIPTASACYATDPTLNYVVCGSEKYDDVHSLVDYVVEGVRLVLGIVDHAT